MTNYQQEPGSVPPGMGGPADPHGQGTEQMPPVSPPPQSAESGQWRQQGQPVYAQAPYQASKPRRRMQVRSTFLTSEFWVLVVLSLAILVAAAIVDEDDGIGFGAHDAWKYITWLGIAYILSRGLTKFSGGRRDGGDSGTHV